MVPSRLSALDGGFDVHEERAHVGRPRLVILVGDELQLAQVVGIAQRMGTGRIVKVRPPVIMEGPSVQFRQNTDRVHRDRAPFGLHAVVTELGRTG